jgi:hypothetical protein
VVEQTCLSNNDRINLFKNLEMPVVGVFINDTIGLNGVASYENKQCIYSYDRKKCEYSLLYEVWV